MSAMNCATGALVPYIPNSSNPWDKKKVLHLFRRLGFGITPEEASLALASSPEKLVDALIDQAISLPLPKEPEWATWNINDYEDYVNQADQQRIQWIIQWVKDMAQNGLREKMTLFWQNHFVTKLEAYQCPSYLYQYHTLLQSHAFGNFKTFAKEMGKTPAMLIFLNGVQNTNLEPNENYARELYELFTLGRDNGYTQEDIKETARALTGWVGFFAFCAPIGFVDVFHDKGPKTIFGQTGNWGYEEVHDLLFEYRGLEVATYICSKIYTHFVHPEPDEAIIAGMAQTFLSNNFEIAPVLRKIFKSEHFFDEKVIGTQFKSPVDLFLSFIRDGGFLLNDEIAEAVTYLTFQLGQQLFNQPDVSGWPGNRAWVNNNTLTQRWQAITYYIYYLYQNAPQSLVNIAKTLSNNSIDPEVVTRSIIDHFIPNGLHEEEAYFQATEVFKFEVPQNYFDNGLWNLDWEVAPIQITLLFQHLNQLPEFQLQ